MFFRDIMFKIMPMKTVEEIIHIHPYSPNQLSSWILPWDHHNQNLLVVKSSFCPRFNLYWSLSITIFGKSWCFSIPSRWPETIACPKVLSLTSKPNKAAPAAKSSGKAGPRRGPPSSPLVLDRLSGASCVCQFRKSHLCFRIFFFRVISWDIHGINGCWMGFTIWFILW
jgi:hypothetical protein